MNIYIMTRGREGKIETIKHIPPEYEGNTYIVCPPGEQHPHQTIYAHIPNENHSKKFQWCLDNLDFPAVIVDDDVHFSVRRTTKSFTKPTGLEELTIMWRAIENQLRFYPMVGVHPRQMANYSPRTMKENGKIICVYGINLDLFPQPMPDICAVPIMGEQILNYHCLSHGKKTCILTEWAQDHGPSQAPGGCDYRTAELQEQAAKYVAEQYAPYVKAVLKRPKQATWLGAEFWDVRVQWKRMYLESMCAFD